MFLFLNPETRAALIGVDLLTKGDTGLYALEKDSTTLPRFLNRLLGVPVRLQNQLFAYFTDSLANIIKKAKRTGSWDGGIRGKGHHWLDHLVGLHDSGNTLRMDHVTYMYIMVS